MDNLERKNIFNSNKIRLAIWTNIYGQTSSWSGWVSDETEKKEKSRFLPTRTLHSCKYNWQFGQIHFQILQINFAVLTNIYRQTSSGSGWVSNETEKKEKGRFLPKRALHPCNADVVIAKIHPLIKGNIRFFTRRRVLLIPVHLGALYGEREWWKLISSNSQARQIQIPIWRNKFLKLSKYILK